MSWFTTKFNRALGFFMSNNRKIENNSEDSGELLKQPPFPSLNPWFIVLGSAIGKLHISQNIPCQDDSHFLPLSTDWGIAVVCDGAGSAKNSDKGAKFTAQVTAKCFGEVINSKGWITNNQLPTQEEWEEIAKDQFKIILSGLNQYSIENNMDLSSLACTVIVTIYSPMGLLVSHIGDGRAGFCTEEGQWFPTITPHKGEEANQTVFITSNSWLSQDELIMSGVSVPESTVFKQNIKAFTLMSDGCEQHSFECSHFKAETQKWSDPNLPYPKFFNPLVSQIKKTIESTESQMINEQWEIFLKEGTEGLKNEPDDKTLILGVRL